HRDVKPANILLERGVDRVILTDFGLARATDDASLTRTGLIAGTPQYMSPEQARGELIDIRSDLFSLGSVMYAMATGRPPFRAETSYGILRRVVEEQPRSVCELNPEVPRWLERIIVRLLAKLPHDRFQNAGELADLLERCLAHVRQPQRIALPGSIAAEPFWRRTGVRWATFSVVVMSIAGLAASGMFSRFGSGSVVDTQSRSTTAPDAPPAVVAPVAESAGNQNAIGEHAGNPRAESVRQEAVRQWNDFDQSFEQLDRETESLWQDVMSGPGIFPEGR
ncbi:MAG: serine/threonine protein kinase, partial [Planctomycetaceae bacterium]|nr:serine/threonine protein kinase [Planctomycetaceae bacterium]